MGLSRDSRDGLGWDGRADGSKAGSGCVFLLYDSSCVIAWRWEDDGVLLGDDPLICHVGKLLYCEREEKRIFQRDSISQLDIFIQVEMPGPQTL